MPSPRPYYSFLHVRDEAIASKTFFDRSEFGWAKAIEQHWPELRKELMDYIGAHRDALQPYFVPDMMNQPRKWQTLAFFFWGIPYKKYMRACPRTMQILRQVPGIVSASLSVMEPRSEIKGHHGDTNAIYRCHLPLEVPAGLPDTGFQVGYEQRPWEEGTFLIFNDAAYHKGWNHTDRRRVILIIDVMRPEFASQKTWACAMVIGALTVHRLSTHIPLFKSKRLWFKYLCNYTYAGIAWCYLKTFSGILR